MLRNFFFSALAAVALLATTEAQAQTAPAPSRQAYRKAVKAQRVLSKREKQAAEAAARAEQARLDAQAAAMAAGTTLNGWDTEPLPAPATPNHAARNYNVSVAPGMPLNQLSHGVTTDYNGRPLRVAQR